MRNETPAKYEKLATLAADGTRTECSSRLINNYKWNTKENY